MSEITIKLIELLKQGKTGNEICADLNITPKKLFYYLTLLSNKGFLCRRTFYEDGNIKYNLVRYLSELNGYYKRFDTNIAMNPEHQELRCLVISDLHFGNSLERLDLIDKVYEYCIKNNIHIILCCGDLIDGTFTHEVQNITSVYQQIEHFIHDYPSDPSILTFAVAGDHDLSGLKDEGQDIVTIVKNYRHDIVLSMYNNFLINIKNDQIVLFHRITGGQTFFENASIALCGHAHKYLTEMKNKKLQIVVPSLSDISSPMPTAIDLTLQFRQGLIDLANMKQIFFGEIPCILSEITYDELIKIQGKTTQQKPQTPINQLIKEEIEVEDKSESEEHEKKLVLGKPRLSQIEKFNKRFHL